MILSGNGKYATGAAMGLITYAAIVEQVKNPANVDKPAAQWAIFTAIQNNTTPLNRGVEDLQGIARCALWLDIDKGNIPINTLIAALREFAPGCQFLVYSSKSSNALNKKWRGILPVAAAIAPDDYQTQQHNLAAWIDSKFGAGTCDKTTVVSSTTQPCYLPNKGVWYEHHIEPGVLGCLPALEVRYTPPVEQKMIDHSDKPPATPADHAHFNHLLELLKPHVANLGMSEPIWNDRKQGWEMDCLWSDNHSSGQKTSKALLKVPRFAGDTGSYSCMHDTCRSIAPKNIGDVYRTFGISKPVDWSTHDGTRATTPLISAFHGVLENICPGINIQQIIDPDKAAAVMSGVLWVHKSKSFIMLNPENAVLNHYTLADMPGQLTLKFGALLNLTVIQDDETKTAVKKAFHALLFTHIKANNQRNSMTIEEDMFVSSPVWSFSDPYKACLQMPHTPFKAKAARPQVKEHAANVATLCEYYPWLNEYIKSVVGARFVNDRKGASTFLQAGTNGGKGFLASALTDVGLLVQINEQHLKQIDENKPVGLELGRMQSGCWILYIDEWLKVTNAIKKIDNSITAAEKYGMEITINVYSRLFSNAVMPSSLVNENGNFESQIGTRFNHLVGQDSAMEENPMLAAYGGHFDGLHASLQHYIVDNVNHLVKQYVELGKENAALAGKNAMRVFRDQFKLGGSFVDVEHAIPEYAEQFVNWLTHPLTEFQTVGAGTVGQRRLNKNGILHVEGLAKLIFHYFTEEKEYSALAKRKQILMHLTGGVRIATPTAVTVGNKTVKGRIHCIKSEFS